MARDLGSPRVHVDLLPLVGGSDDSSKQVRFEVDGLTANTTRVITVPDADITLDDDGASRPPSGAAGGSLGGTYPNPTISGLSADVLSGVAGRQTHDDTAYLTVGAIRLPLGTAGHPTAGRTLTVGVVMSCTDAVAAYKVQLYNPATAAVVGAAITGAHLVPTISTLDVSAAVGTSLTDDAVNLLLVQIGQQNVDAAELAICDCAQIEVSY